MRGFGRFFKIGLGLVAALCQVGILLAGDASASPPFSGSGRIQDYRSYPWKGIMFLDPGEVAWINIEADVPVKCSVLGIIYNPELGWVYYAQD